MADHTSSLPIGTNDKLKSIGEWISQVYENYRRTIRAKQITERQGIVDDVIDGVGTYSQEFAQDTVAFVKNMFVSIIMSLNEFEKEKIARMIYLCIIKTLFESYPTGCTHICETDNWYRDQLCMEFVAGLRYQGTL